MARQGRSGRSPKRPAAEVAAAAEPLPRESFIPLRQTDLVAMLVADVRNTPPERRQLGELAERLAQRVHAEFHRVLRELKDVYAAFDPDADTHVTHLLSAPERDRQTARLFDDFTWMLERANYRRLSRDDIRTAMETATQWGVNLRVDLELFERLEVFARGDAISRRSFKAWKKFRKPVQVDVPIYRRLVLMFRLRERVAREEHLDADTVYIKVFKNIPKMDLDMLLPGTQVRMTMLDRGKIFVPTLSGGVITAVKLVQGALVLATAGVYGVLAFVGVVGGSLGYGLRSFHGYVRTQQRYQLNLTRSLYYQNLDNNAGVIFRLLDEAEDQECREGLLAWYFLWREAGPDGWSRDELDHAIEAFLHAHLPTPVDFEISDALAKLVRLGLVTEVGERLQAVPLEAAVAILRESSQRLAAGEQAPVMIPREVGQSTPNVPVDPGKGPIP